VRRLVVIALTLWLLTPGSAGAQADLNPELRAFLRAWRAAARAGDRLALSALTHPASRACEDEGDADAYEKMRAQQLRVFGNALEPSDRRFVPTEAKELRSFREHHPELRWPVAPEGRIVVRFERPSGTRVAQLPVARSHGAWRWVHVCVPGAPRAAAPSLDGEATP